MPRKPRKKKQIISILVNGQSIQVTLFPPDGKRRSWYAYWAGLKTRRSTGESDFKSAVMAVGNMLHHGGTRPDLADAILSDGEFDEIQRRHYQKKWSPEARRRSEKSYTACMEAVAAFRRITGITPITRATPADCERFQYEALKKPRNWRSRQPDGRTTTGNTLSPNTVIKWSVALQAAFERANTNASGRKCVRGVVEDARLLTSNPWQKFQWIQGFNRRIRQFSDDELLSILNYLETDWSGVAVAPAFAKTLLWSWGRRQEITTLRWDDVRCVGEERHFEIIGKWGITKWFRLPEGLYQELVELRTDSPYVFAAFPSQLRAHHAAHGHPWEAHAVRSEFNPKNLGEWFYRRILHWSRTVLKIPACVHTFRKTSLQYARSGEDVNQRVAADARVGAGVLMKSYAKETDLEMRQRSNRTFARIAASLPVAVAERYGCEIASPDPLVAEFRKAVAAGNWDLVARLSAELAKRDQQAG